MRKLLALGLILFSFNAFSTHLFGGEISWKCNGNGQYIFHLKLYRECGVPAATLPNNTSITGPFGLIPVSVQTQLDISPSCYGSGIVVCGASPAGAGAMEMYAYKSAPVSLAGTPPPSGWSFSYSDCCRSGLIINAGTGAFFIESKMYAGPGGCNSSPYFVENPAVGINEYNKSLSVMALAPNVSDSLYYDLIAPQTAASTLIVFNNGYSASSPFPNPSTDTANGPVVIDHEFGLVNMDINNLNVGGAFVYGVKVEQWRNNMLLSEVFRDMTIIGRSGTWPNNAPFFSLDSANFNPNSLPAINAFVGDTVYFEFSGLDVDYQNGTSGWQQISFDAKGRALDSTWGGVANYVNSPNIFPINQVGFNRTIRNRVGFNWVLAPEHTAGSVTSHYFNFSFSDDQCPFNGIRNVPVKIIVTPVASISADTIKICQGDSASLVASTKSGNYQWSPSNGLSSTTASTPMASPASSQYYYLTDPSNPGFIDSVFVAVTSRKPFSLAFAAGQLSLTDSTANATKTWFYNGIPFNYPFDTLTPFGLGDYYVIGRTGACQYITDTISITSGMSFSVTAPDNGGYSGSPSVHTGSLGVTFAVNQNVNVSWVSIPGITDLYGKTGGYDLNLKVYDDTQTEIFSTDVTIARPIDNVLKVPTNLNFMANLDYTIVVSGDTGYAFSLYDNMALPATPQNVGFTVKALLGGNAGQFPTTPVTYALPISLGIDRTVSLDELSENDWGIYPNPAREQIHIDGLNGASTIELHDVNGKVVRSISLEKDQREVNINRGELPPGLYFVKVQFDDTTQVKKVLFH